MMITLSFPALLAFGEGNSSVNKWIRIRPNCLFTCIQNMSLFDIDAYMYILVGKGQGSVAEYII